MTVAAHVAAPGSVATAYCRNCGHSLGSPTPNFCAQCGQDTRPHPPSLWEFIHEFVTHYVALEGKLWRTLGLLFCRPGTLTLRYLAGKKASHVPPLRLYLTASILFFIVVKFFGAGSLVKTTIENTAPATNGTQIMRQVPGGGLRWHIGDNTKGVDDKFVDAIECSNFSRPCTRIRSYLAEKYGNRTVRELAPELRARFASYAPYALFCLLPVFALITKVLYWRRGLYYGEHLVYAFHVHAFAFFLMLPMALLSAGWAADLLWIVGMIYYWLAMHRVFGGRWWATTVRYGIIGVTYPLLMAAVIAAAAILAIFL